MQLTSTNHDMNKYQGFKNKIINGNFDIWQRGTSFTSLSNGDYHSDRFLYQQVGTMVHDITRDTDVPSDVNANYSLKLDCTTADTSIAAGDFCHIQQRIEGYNFLPFVGQIATLSFWVKATKTGTYCVAFNNSSRDRSYIVEYTINTTNTWEKKEITLEFDDQSGTWDYTNGIGLYIHWTLDSGSTYQTTANSWESGDYYSTSNQVNGSDSDSNSFLLSNIQFELGSKATEFEYRSIQDEIALCRRYYQKSYNIDVDPGTITNNSSNYLNVTNLNTSTHTVARSIKLNIQMRDTPTIVIYSASSGNSNKVDVNGGEVTPLVSGIGINNFSVSGSGMSGSSATLEFHYTADAEI